MASTTTPPPNGKDIAASVLFKKFLAAAEGYITQPSRLKKLLVDAFNKAREKKDVGTLAHEAWETLQSLFRLIKLSAAGEYTGVPATTVVAAVAVLIYFLSPIDLIPDFIPVVGLLDDMALVAWFSTSIKHELDKFHEWEATKNATVVADEELFQTRGADGSTEWRTSAATAATTNQSAKNSGNSELPTAPAGSDQTATDAGLGSPTSSTTAPIHDIGPDGPLPEAQGVDDIANISDSSRDGNRGQRNDAGGNVR